MGPLQGGGGIIQGGGSSAATIQPARGGTIQPATGAAINRTPLYTTPSSSVVTTTNSNNAAAASAAAAAAATAASQKNAEQTSVNNDLNMWKTLENEQGGNVGAQYRGSLNTLLQTLVSGQLGINQDEQNVQTNKLISINDLINSVRAGLNSGAVGLGNSNALNSSAAEGLARAYGQYGTQQANDVNAQANTAMTQDEQKQAALVQQMQMGESQAGSDKQTALNNLSADAAMRLAAVDSEAKQYGLSPVDVAGLKDQIIQNAQNQISQIDQWFGTATQFLTTPGATSSGISQQTPDQAAAIAYKNYSAGVQPSNPGLFTYSETPVNGSTPGQVSQNNNTNPAPVVSLPLFTTKNQ